MILWPTVLLFLHAFVATNISNFVHGFEIPTNRNVPPPPQQHVLDADVGIVGAGPAGLVLAQALQERGYAVKILERRPSFSPVGAAVFMHPFALRSLRSVSPLLEQQLLKVCMPIRSIHMMSNVHGDNDDNNKNSSMLFGTDQLDKALSVMGAPFVTVKFWDMLCALKEGLPEEIFEFGCTVKRFMEKDDIVSLEYENRNGDTVTTNVSVLFDCGGIRSTIRNQLIGDEAIPRLRVTYAVAKAEKLWSGEQQRDERVLAFVMGDGKSVTTANLPNGDIWWTQTQYDDDPLGRLLQQDSSNDLRAQLDARFADWPSSIRRLVQVTPTEDIIESTLSEFRPVFRWGKGRVTLVGDSAHAQLPALGLGVSTAFADVAELCRQIDRHGLPCTKDPQGNGNAALRWYEAVRIPQTAVLQIASRLAYFMNVYIGNQKRNR
jgi:salicylate hydroxylase